MKQFLLEFGRDFIFMGEEYHLVAIDLKIEDFKPEYLGKMEFYLGVLDRDIRKPHENPFIMKIKKDGGIYERKEKSFEWLEVHPPALQKQVEVTKPFAQEAELAEKLERLSALNALLKNSSKRLNAFGIWD